MTPVRRASLIRELSACRRCEDDGTLPKARPIFQLPERPTVGVFSQAPGNLAHHGGRPFMDPSGVRLRRWMGIDEATFYDSGKVAIVPMAFCFPGYDGTGPSGRGGDLPPPKICAQIWRQRVMSEIMPGLRIILLVGSYAQKWHLGAGMRRTLSETVAAWRERVADAAATGDALMMPMPHPSWRNTGWLKKHPWFEQDVVPLLQAKISAALCDVSES